jgi:hypothetical protein
MHTLHIKTTVLEKNPWAAIGIKGSSLLLALTGTRLAEGIRIFEATTLS